MRQTICTLLLLTSLIICAGAVDDIIGTVNIPVALIGLAGMGISIYAGGLAEKE